MNQDRNALSAEADIASSQVAWLGGGGEWGRVWFPGFFCTSVAADRAEMGMCSWGILQKILLIPNPPWLRSLFGIGLFYVNLIYGLFLKN